MKIGLTWFLAASTLTLAVVCVLQTRQFGGQQTQLAALRAESEEKAQQIKALQAAGKHSDQQRRELMSQAEELAAQLQARQLAESNALALVPTSPPPVTEGDKPEAKKGGFGNLLAKMMQDPDAKKFIRETQRVMTDQLYAPLIKKLGLSPDEAAQFKDLLTDHAMNAAEQASTMFGDQAATNHGSLLTTLSAQQKTFDEQVKAFLGDDRYAQYVAYQATAPQRMQLNAYQQQAGNDYPLNDPQTEALLTFMSEEQKNVAATTGLPLGDANKDPAKLQALLSGDQVGELLQAQDTANQRVYERARTILSPDQLNSFGQFQTNQLGMMRASMGVFRQMFAPAPATTPAAPPNP